MSTINPKAVFVVLGGGDPEMNRIEKSLRAGAIRYGYAVAKGRDGEFARCHPGNAYKGEAVQNVTAGPAPGDTLIRVECAVNGLDEGFGRVVVCDHHNPGDPGWGVGAEGFFGASSIGQVFNLFGWSPCEEVLLTAAADHCPAAAYRGECAGVDPERLMAFRAANTAAFRKLSVTEVLEGVKADVARLEAAEKQLIGGQSVAVTKEPLAYGPEASLRSGVAIISVVSDRDGRRKEVFLGGESSAITAFMASREAEGREVYGNPSRGYAGAYLA